MLLVTSAAAIGALSSSTALLDAQRRHNSNAREAFKSAVQARIDSPLELASLIAAEEHHSDALPRDVATRISAGIDQACALASKRIALSKLVGHDVGPEQIANAVSKSLFGSGAGAADDVTEESFFRGGEGPDYYDPRNSFIDEVLDRRQGIPISLSLIAMEACAQLGLPMVGLNAPMHLLLAPADTSVPFVLDSFGGNGLMTEDKAANFIGARLSDRGGPSVGMSGSGGAQTRHDGKLGQQALSALRASPMSSLSWSARILRNLRGVYMQSGDAARLLGVCDRLRLIGGVSRVAVSDAEMRACAGQVALCIFLLRWTQRRAEARRLLLGLRRDAIGNAASATGGGAGGDEAAAEEELARIDELLAAPWFCE
jgi:regulator of sirC expression with transglutaminase-like and TPR domain